MERDRINLGFLSNDAMRFLERMASLLTLPGNDVPRNSSAWLHSRLSLEMMYRAPRAHGLILNLRSLVSLYKSTSLIYGSDPPLPYLYHSIKFS